MYNINLLYLSLRTRAVIGQFRGPYSSVRPANLVFSVRTVSYGSSGSFFPVDLWLARFALGHKSTIKNSVRKRYVYIIGISINLLLFNELLHLVPISELLHHEMNI